MKVVVSPFKNPFLNLALEDYFLRSGEDLPLLFLYVNRSCVVLGRFQNPWRECQLPYLVEKDIWLVRRQSGGGCVFHDEGNLNYSFITSDPMIDRQKHLKVMQAAFERAGIHLTTSARNDLWLDGRKISGSAYKQTKFGSFHHGTFLVNSDLEALEESLKYTLIPKDSKAIDSVRSKVITLQEKFPGTEIDDVIELLMDHVQGERVEIDATLLARFEIQESFRQLTSWEWLWGETPAFSLDDLKVRKGMIEGLAVRFEAKNLKASLSEKQIGNYFPDFSLQEETRQQVF
jgi:lipoate-protein ligase A